MAVARQGERAADLRSRLHARVRARGPIPFSDFMETALYHPEEGYYCREGITTGPEGDYYTSPDLHPAFGLLIARQVAEIADKACAGRRGSFHVVEAGPGTGRLARDLIAGLARERPDLARRVVHTLVEVSGPLRRAQREAIAEGGEAGRLEGLRWRAWDDLPAEVGPEFSGCVVANEFLDALPVHIVERGGGRVLEVHVDSDGARFTEVLLEPSDPRLAGHFDALGIVLEEGQRAEVSLAALDWVSSLGRLFGPAGRGGAILVDYGHPARELYDPARHRGTLMCYRRHRALEDPYLHPGEQDLTAHVDFTSVRRRAAQAGFDAAPLVTQMRFLVALGLADLLAGLGVRETPASGAAGAVRERLALHSLMAPGGMGEIFKVQLLSRGFPVSELTGAGDPFR